MKLGLQITGRSLRQNPNLFNFLSDFQALTPGGDFGVKQCYTQKDNPDFEITDWNAENLVARSLEIHGHCLLQGNFDLPRWRELENHEFEFKLKAAVQAICDRYQGFIAEWEFLGEIVSPRGGLNNSLLRSRLGPGFAKKIYQWIREVDASVPLYYSEYGLEAVDKADATVKFCESLLVAGRDLAGIAIQFHHNTKGARNIPGIARAIAQFQSLGLKVKLSEVTIWRDAILGPISAYAQAEAYGKMLELAIATNCESFTFWCPFDTYAWKLAERNPGLWNTTFTPTLSFKRVKKIF